MISPGRGENKQSLQPPPSLFSGGTVSFKEGIPHLPTHQSRFSTKKNTCPMSISLTISCAVRGESGISRIHCVTCPMVTHHRKAGRAFLSFLRFVSVRWKIMPYQLPPKKQFVCLVNFSPMETWSPKKTTTHFFVLVKFHIASRLNLQWIYSSKF